MLPAPFAYGETAAAAFLDLCRPLLYMGDNDVWDIFCDVMAKKRDYITISHITLGIGRFCEKVNVNDGHIFGGIMTGDQRTNILNSLQSVYERSSNRSIKGKCLRTIEELENTKDTRFPH